MAQRIIGTVSSDKRDKTITVTVASRETHPLYRKQYTKTRKYTAHDEKNEAGLGDRVEIEACRPFAKTVTYKLVKVLEKSKGRVELNVDVDLPEKDIPAKGDATGGTNDELHAEGVNSVEEAVATKSRSGKEDA